VDYTAVEDILESVLPEKFCNLTAQARRKIITETAVWYILYRRHGYSPKNARVEAQKRTGDTHTQQRAQRKVLELYEKDYQARFEEDLEEMRREYEKYYAGKLATDIKHDIALLEDVLLSILELKDQIAPLDPSEISYKHYRENLRDSSPIYDHDPASIYDHDGDDFTDESVEKATDILLEEVDMRRDQVKLLLQCK